MFNDNELTDVYVSIRSRLMAAVSRIVPPNDIEDIVQETYVRVCQIENKQTINYPRMFMFKTARNLAIDSLKRAESRLVKTGVTDEDEFEAGFPEKWADEPYERRVSSEKFEMLCQAVRLLPRQCRRVFVLKKVYGFSQKEIAQKLNLSESTVEKHISTGMKRCTHFMSRHPDYGMVESASKRNDLAGSQSSKVKASACHEED